MKSRFHFCLVFQHSLLTVYSRQTFRPVSWVFLLWHTVYSIFRVWGTPTCSELTVKASLYFLNGCLKWEFSMTFSHGLNFCVKINSVRSGSLTHFLFFVCLIWTESKIIGGCFNSYYVIMCIVTLACSTSCNETCKWKTCALCHINLSFYLVPLVLISMVIFSKLFSVNFL